MTDESKTLLEQAEELLRGGKRQMALPLLAEYLQGHPNSARGWWMLSLAVSDLRQQIDCMERVLVIDPNYTPAHARLEKLERMLEPRAPSSPVPPFVAETTPYPEIPTFPAQSRTAPDFLQEEPAAEPDSLTEPEEPAYRWDEASSTPWSSSYLDEEPRPAPKPPAAASFNAQPAPKPRRPAKKMPEWFLPVIVGLALVCLVVGVVGGVLLWQSQQPIVVTAPPPPFVTVPPRTMAPTWTPAPSQTPPPTFTPIPGQTTDPNSPSTPVSLGNQEGTSMGMLAPDFALKDVDGAQVSLSGYRGRPVLLFFWATWCPYCRSETESLHNIYETYKSEGLVVLAVEVGESSADGRSYRSEHGLTFPILNDSRQSVFRLYQGQYLPTNYFIDPGGRISYSAVGLMDYSSINLRVRALLNLIPTAAP